MSGAGAARAHADEAELVGQRQPHEPDAGRRARRRPPVRRHRVREAGARRGAAQPELRLPPADRRRRLRRQDGDRQP